MRAEKKNNTSLSKFQRPENPEINENQWNSMKNNETQWKSVKICSKPCSFLLAMSLMTILVQVLGFSVHFVWFWVDFVCFCMILHCFSLILKAKSMKNNEKQWKTMRFNENQWKINTNRMKSTHGSVNHVFFVSVVC